MFLKVLLTFMLTLSSVFASAPWKYATEYNESLAISQNSMNDDFFSIGCSSNASNKLYIGISSQQLHETMGKIFDRFIDLDIVPYEDQWGFMPIVGSPLLIKVKIDNTSYILNFYVSEGFNEIISYNFEYNNQNVNNLTNALKKGSKMSLSYKNQQIFSTSLKGSRKAIEYVEEKCIY